MKSIRTNPANHAPEGDERIRTAVCSPSDDAVYESPQKRLERIAAEVRSWPAHSTIALGFLIAVLLLWPIAWVLS